jgi:hypothetical protein
MGLTGNGKGVNTKSSPNWTFPQLSIPNRSMQTQTTAFIILNNSEGVLEAVVDYLAIYRSASE